MSRAVMHDMTELTRLRAKLRQLLSKQDAMLYNDRIGMLKGHDRYVVWANRGAHRALGHPEGALAGQPTRLLYRDDAAFEPAGHRFYGAPESGGPYRSPLELLHRVGHSLRLDSSVAPISGPRQETL